MGRRRAPEIFINHCRTAILRRQPHIDTDMPGS